MNIQFPASQSMAPATAAMPNSVAATNGESSRKSLAEIQAKLHAANEEKGLNQPEVTTIQQEEEVFISGSNARLMVMQNLSRKSEVSNVFLLACWIEVGVHSAHSRLIRICQCASLATKLGDSLQE